MASALAMLLGGCASEAPHKRNEPSGGGLRSSYRPGTYPIGGAEADDGLVVENQRGALAQGDVDVILERHGRALIACYERAGEAQRYVAGEVLLRFFVGRTGQVSNVLVVNSLLGNYAVERCLVAEGRKIVFPPPEGDRATDFDYSLQFRSTEEVGLVDWGPEVLRGDLAALSPQLAACGDLGGRPVRAVVYIEPDGSVGSVGLSSEEPLDATASLCVVEQLQSWRLPGTEAQVVRTSVTVAPLPRPTPPRPVDQVFKRARRRSAR